MAAPPDSSERSNAAPEPGSGFAIAITAAALTSGLYVAARATRDAVFLTTLGASNLPPAIMASAVLAIGASFGLSLWLRRWSPLRTTPASFAAIALLFGTAWWRMEAEPEVVAVGLYLVVTGLVPLVLASFWAVVNERFDPYSAKRMVSHMATAGALGGAGGGLGAERLAAAVGVPPLLLILALTSLACAVVVRAIGAPKIVVVPPPPRRGEASLPALWRRPLLRQMAILMFLVAAVETLVEYALNVEAQARFPDAAELVRFFALFYTTCGVLSFVLQLSLGTPILQRLGLAAAIALLPLSVGITGAIAVGVGRFWGYVLARGAETVISVSFFRAGFQLLYTPVPSAVKRPAKAWVDVASGSVGDIVGAGLIAGMLAFTSDLPSNWVVAIALIGCLGGLALVQRIHRSYVGQLTDSLKAGQLAMRVEDALDATTALTIAHSHASLDRNQLLDEIRTFRAEQADPDEVAEPWAAPVASGIPPEADGTDDASLAARAVALTSDDPAQRRRGLREAWTGLAKEDAYRLIGLAIPSLSDEELHEDAEAFVRRFGRRSIGQLLDVALDSSESRPRRIQLISILAELNDPRSLEGLIRAAGDGDFEIRFAAARAAARQVHRSNQAGPPRADVYALVFQELALPEAHWVRNGQRPRRTDTRDRSVLVRGRALADISRSLEHVFTVLSLTHDRTVMASTLSGLTSGDPALRGTALEYLESILPPDLRRSMWTRLHAPAHIGDHHRSRDAMAEELLRTQVDLVVDREDLERD